MSDPTIDSASPLIRRHEKRRTDRIAARLAKSTFLVSEAWRHERPWLRWLATRIGASANLASAVVYDGVGDYLEHTSGPTGAADGATLTVAWAGTFNSDGSTMTLVDIPGTVPVQLVRQSDNTIDFIGGTAGAVFSNSTTAVAASLGFLIILASCNGTSSTLKVVHAAATITGTNTPGIATNLDMTADWFLGSNGGASEWLDADTSMWWLDDAEIDFTVANNIEQFWDTTLDMLRDPGSDGSNPVDAAYVPLICHVNPAASHTVNRGTGGDADVGTTFEDGTSPGAYSPDFVPPATFALTDSASDGANSAASTFSAMSIGAADPTRAIVVVIGAHANLAGPGASPTVTLGGDLMTEVVSAMGSSGNVRARSHIYVIAQSALSSPSATTADIIVTYGGQHFGKRIAVYRMTECSVTASATGSSTNVDPLTDTITFPDGGVVVAGSVAEATCGWTNITELDEAALTGGGSKDLSSGGDAGVTSGATAVTADWATPGTNSSLVMAAFPLA